MKKTFLNKRIPSLFGLFLLAMLMGMISWFGKNYTQLQSRASVGEVPKQLRVSNITDTSFTVSYTTDERVIGVINYGRDLNRGQIRLDDSDKESSARQVHHITISGLDPETKYYFSVKSGSTDFLNDHGPYEVRTAKKLPENSLGKVSVKGSINLPDGTIPSEGIVYLSTASNAASQLFSIPVKIDGTYNLSVNYLRTSDLTSYVALEKDTILQMTIKNAVSQSLVIVNIIHANPVPPVTLSKNYDFTITSSSASFTASESGFPVFSSSIASEPAILTPMEAEKFIDQQPLFRGTAASPNAQVVIIIESAVEIRANVEADNFGYWQFRPASPLEPGRHTVTIQTPGASDVKQTITRSFTVFAAGSQFTEPSVSPTLRVTPTPIKPTPTLINFPTVTQSPTVPTLPPSITPTSIKLNPTATSAPIILQTITPTSQPISPPGSSLFLIGGALATLSITAGFMLFFFL